MRALANSFALNSKWIISKNLYLETTGNSFVNGRGIKLLFAILNTTNYCHFLKMFCPSKIPNTFYTIFLPQVHWFFNYIVTEIDGEILLPLQNYFQISWVISVGSRLQTLVLGCLRSSSPLALVLKVGGPEGLLKKEVIFDICNESDSSKNMRNNNATRNVAPVSYTHLTLPTNREV